VSRPLIYDRGFKNSIHDFTDKAVIKLILPKLSDQHVFVNTAWLQKDDALISVISKDKIAVCYSGADWENTNDDEMRKEAHEYIKNNSKDVIHVGNTKGKYYFNWCAESVRRHPKGFFDERYITEPLFDKIYMCLNRKPHQHRKLLIEQLEKHDLLEQGLVSFAEQIQIDEQLDERLVRIGEGVCSGRTIKNDIISLGDPNNWSRCFINVVTESTINSNFMISEKTWKPIAGMRPFLILGDTNIYSHLKEEGFDTFDDIFGTWWQDENWENRAKDIPEILKKFNIKMCQELYNDIYLRLKKNREHFIEYMESNHNKIINLPL
jgi:hypothetical protein